MDQYHNLLLLLLLLLLLSLLLVTFGVHIQKCTCLKKTNIFEIFFQKPLADWHL